MSNEKQIELRLDKVGRGMVVLDGEDLSDRVSRVDVHASAGDPLRITLTILGHGLDAELEAESVEIRNDTADRPSPMQGELRG